MIYVFTAKNSLGEPLKTQRIRGNRPNRWGQVFFSYFSQEMCGMRNRLTKDKKGKNGDLFISSPKYFAKKKSRPSCWSHNRQFSFSVHAFHFSYCCTRCRSLKITVENGPNRPKTGAKIEKIGAIQPKHHHTGFVFGREVRH